MEPEVVRTERRGRKRKRNDVQSTHMDNNPEKTAVPSRSIVLIRRYMTKEFEENSVFIGKVVSYNRGLYRVDYENGVCEDLDSSDVKAYLVEEEDMDDDFYRRKKNLDDYVLNKYANDEAVKSASVANPVEPIGHTVELANQAEKVESLSNGDVVADCEAQIEVDSDSCSDLSDSELCSDMAEAELITIPTPPQLPPSSGNIGISEEHVSYLLSVYSFLRSFSVCLFLSPFGLDEFVGALNSSVHNTLLDAIHVAVTRTLKSRLEMLSSEGLEAASKCLRSTDWSLLDSLTWPVFVVQYLMTMRYTEGSEWKEFYINVLEKEYYALSAGKKLIILQILCDDALDSMEIRAEIDMREESEVGSDPDGVLEYADEHVSRRLHSRHPKASVKNDCGIPMTTQSSSENSLSFNNGPNTDRVDEDVNGDECRLCGMDGMLLCCDGCPSAYHSRCIGVSKLSIPKGAWYCMECAINKSGPNVTRFTSLRGAVLFGVDPYGQVFSGTCDHLLVMKGSGSLEQCFRYYALNDIHKVLCALNYSVESTTVYSEICKGILQYWEIPDDMSSLTHSVGLDKKIGNAPELYRTKNVLNGVTVIKPEDTTPSRPQENCSKLASSKGANQLSGSSFKRQAYLNLYTQGDFAASCAASLAILSSERAPESQPSSSSHRKSMSANYSLQIKAFSLAAKRFYWPNSERKLVEVPREKCGWCLSCKVNGKRGCLLNASALNATKIAAKTLASLCTTKIVDGGLASIATYVMFMEESLRGLTVGSFRSATYRERWRKQVEEAATLSAIKASLLEFESSIRSIAFSADWTKLVDDMGLENPVPQSASSVVGSTQKQGPGRKRGRKPRMSEVTNADTEDESTEFAWWRGGMLSKCVFHKGILPQSIIKNAARQGGCGKIDGVHYLEGFEVPKRSRQFIWRAAVETSKTVSQLALQVRHLDDHVRWNDLVCPDQPPQDAKGAEAEASAFRNACIVDKKVVENKTRYGVVFENQKHLPSRVLKNILEVEKIGEAEKYWLIETHIPLYLIKEYEKAAEEAITPSADEHVNTLSFLQRKLLKASGKNIFSFLSKKRENNLGKCLCISCQLDISFRNAATCSACQGYCHEQCTFISTTQMNAQVNFSVTCKQCHLKMNINARNENIANSPTSPLLLRGQQGQLAVTSINGLKQNGYRGPLESLNQSSNKKLTTNHSNATKSGNLKGKNHQSEVKPQKKLPLGLRWRKKNMEDTGVDFRLNNLVLKNNPNRHLLAPLCYICMKPYNPDLMYICCETCKKWCHADALELKESKISDLVGFKCCKCRRMRSPICPYMDPETVKKILEKYPHLKTQTQPNLASDSNSEINYEPVNNQELDSVTIQEDENSHLLTPVVEQVNPHNTAPDLEYGPGPVSGPAPQKLPFRRHNDLEVSMDGFENDIMMGYEGLNCEDMEFEPQTYFSFKELLASDDHEVNPSENLTGNWDNNSSAAALNISYDHQEPMFSVESGADMVSCGVCSKTDPCPDLFCGTCQLAIHSYCSPWDEEAGGSEGGWKCGHCRDWRQ